MNRAWMRDPLRAGMEARVRGTQRLALGAALTLAFFALALKLCAAMEGAAVIALVGAGCAALLLAGAWRALREEPVIVLLCAALLAMLAVAAHLAMLDIKPGRMSKVLAPMLEGMWNYDFGTAMAWEDGAWSGGYLIVMALISRLEAFPQMYAVKLFDMACQTAAALAVLKLALTRGAKPGAAVGAMLACVLAPTMLLSAGCWAQCDAMFAALALWGLALLLNKKNVRGSKIWRAFPILAYAIPGFISMLGFKFMFSQSGPINSLLAAAGKDTIFFLTNDASAKWWARGIGLFVNAWISVPSIMLMTTGILTNINHDLYEASSLDGATPFQQFRKITLPFVVFSTTPVLIGQFVGNFNNFGIFFFIRSGVISNYGDYFLASDTDLLINWLYNLSVDNNYYSVGAAISLMIFVITATLSLTVYIRSAAYKQEDTYQ